MHEERRQKYDFRDAPRGTHERCEHGEGERYAAFALVIGKPSRQRHPKSVPEVDENCFDHGSLRRGISVAFPRLGNNLTSTMLGDMDDRFEMARIRRLLAAASGKLIQQHIVGRRADDWDKSRYQLA
jgi:hypothetical protein